MRFPRPRLASWTASRHSRVSHEMRSWWQWHSGGEARLMSCRMRRNFWSDCCRNTLRSTTSCSAQRPHAGAWKAKPRFRNAPCTPLGLLEIGGSLQAVLMVSPQAASPLPGLLLRHLAQHELSRSRRRVFTPASGRREEKSTHAAHLQESPAMSSRMCRPEESGCHKPCSWESELASQLTDGVGYDARPPLQLTGRSRPPG